ncbi:MAG: helix-turn-helix domain-containing protein [Prevotella sp.]
MMRKVTLYNIMHELEDVANIETSYADDDVVCFRFAHNARRVITESVVCDMFFFLGCKQGQARITSINNTYIINQNEILFIKPTAKVFCAESSDNFIGYGFAFSGKLANGIIYRHKSIQRLGFELNRHPIIRLDGNDTELMELYGDMIRVKMKRPDRMFMKDTIHRLICNVLLDLLACHKEKGDNVPEDKQALNSADRIFEKFANILLEDKGINRKVNYYADSLCITPKYLSYVCRTVCGKTALTLINEAMVENIKYYLEYTDLSIKEIVNKLDFPNLSFFGHYVKTHLGKSPSAYRSELIKSGTSPKID